MMYRKDKNILSTEIIQLENIESCKIIYNTDPEIIFEKNINSYSYKKDSVFYFKNFQIIAKEDSFYNYLHL